MNDNFFNFSIHGHFCVIASLAVVGASQIPYLSMIALLIIVVWAAVGITIKLASAIVDKLGKAIAQDSKIDDERRVKCLTSLVRLSEKASQDNLPVWADFLWYAAIGFILFSGGAIFTSTMVVILMVADCSRVGDYSINKFLARVEEA